MMEIELKLQIAPGELSAIRYWLKTLGAKGRRLRTLYFDTEDDRLLSDALALRLRYDRNHWVQTLKSGEAGPLARFEHEVVVQRGGPDHPPELQPSLHQGSAPGERLIEAISEAEPLPLQLRFETDIHRIALLKRSRRGTVELSLDVGVIRAPSSNAHTSSEPTSLDDRRPQIRLVELEIELNQGSPHAVLDVARQFLRDHHCWLDQTTKAERGYMLAAGRTLGDAARAGPVIIDPKANLQGALSPVLADCRRQLVANLARLASSSVEWSQDVTEYVHQARVGLRRLRTACRLFALAEVRPLDEPAGELSRALGSARNRDVLIQSIAPALIQAGAPTAELSHPELTIDPCALAVKRATQNLLVDLIGKELALEAVASGAITTHAREPSADKQAGPALTAVLARWHRKIRNEARQFESLDAQARHRLRRRMKRLRYGTEFCQALCGANRRGRFLKRLSAAQEALGLYNDLIEALEQYRSQVDRNPQSWFAVGWLTAEAEAQARRCTEALAAFRDCKPPWKKRFLIRASEIEASVAMSAQPIADLALDQ
jgi:triphosphatase